VRLPKRVRRWRKALDRRTVSAIRPLVLRHRVPPAALGLQKIGSGYGGWVVPTALIDETWTCYCGGVGEDITFDLGLIDRFGCRVFAFDPTPRAVAHVAAVAAEEPRFRFLPVGLWSEDSTLRFFAPRNPAHVSHSVVNLQRTTNYFEAPVRALPGLMQELGTVRIDLLKLDIEGAEHQVVRSMLEGGIRPGVVCLEIDQPVRPRVFWGTVRRLRSAGFALVAVDGWNLTFLREDLIDAAAVGKRTGVRPPPKVTFGIIVLDGEPFTAHTIRALYPYAHEIIVVEGAAPGARNIATPDGHSRDGTLDVLRTFASDEDPDRKLTIVTAEDDGHPNGFWPGEKHEQSQAYARRATGDYLWQVDIDEFYRAEDIERVLDRLGAEPRVDAVSFRQITFWGGLGYDVDGWYLRRGAADYHRLFRWGPGFTYANHRPPTVRDAAGRDLRKGTWIDAATTASWGVRLYHYSLLLPKQVIEKCDYYANAEWARRSGALDWANEAWLQLNRPFRVHNVFAYPSWLERFHGRHPDEVVRMMDRLSAEDGGSSLRRTDDIERLLGAPWYRVARFLVRGLDPWDLRVRRLGARARLVPAAARRLGRRGVRVVRRVGRRPIRVVRRVLRRPAPPRPLPPSPDGRPLRVVQVAKYPQGGGAEGVARSLHRGLLARGMHSRMATTRRDPDDPTMLRIPPRRRDSGNVATRGLRSLADRRGREDFDFPGTRRIASLSPERPDVLHLHNLHGRYFDLRQLAPLSHRLPVAMTLHDEWTFTGHCAYALYGDRWRNGCGSCPDLEVYPAIRADGTRANLKAKASIYERSRLYVSTPSRWLMERARASVLAPGVAGWRVIPNGIDLSAFRPGDRDAARARLGIPTDPFVLLFTANQARRSPFKDWDTVAEAAERVATAVTDRPILCLALGDDGPARRLANGGELRFEPYRSEVADVVAFYQAADLYLHAAKADTFPTTILEALATGLPVVATAVGGIPEEVRSLAHAPGAWEGDGVAASEATGVLVGPGDAAGMAAAAVSLIHDGPLRAAMGSNAVTDAASRFDLERQLDETIAWYRELIADWRDHRARRG
jgi:FkbM family methyltransferase